MKTPNPKSQTNSNQQLPNNNNRFGNWNFDIVCDLKLLEFLIFKNG